MNLSYPFQKKRLWLYFCLLMAGSSVSAAPVTPGMFETKTQPEPPTTSQPVKPDCVDDELELPNQTLQRQCSHVIAHGNLHIDYSMAKAAATLLDRFIKKHPEEKKIERCVVLTPEGGNVDEQIKTYNTKTSSYNKTHTIFLLLGKGVKTPVDPMQPESCPTVKPVFAGSDNPPVLPPPATWQDSFNIKHSIVLEPGQKLIGVPVDVSHSRLAEGYYVSIKRKITTKINCFNYRYKSMKITKDSFITLKGKGIFVTGITNAFGVNDSLSVYETCGGYFKEKVRDVTAQEAHQQIIRVEIDPTSLHTPTSTAMIDISNNELFQIQQPAISIALKKSDGETAAIQSDWLFDQTFVRTKGNHIYSCRSVAGKEPLAPAFVADFTYVDYAPEPGKVHTLDLQNNLIITHKNSAADITLSTHADATLTGNHLQAIGDSLYGVALTGGTHDGTPARTFRLEDNTVSGFRTALLLNGSLRLALNSNDLLGLQRAIERGEWKLYPVALSGDSHNTYQKGVQHPCQNLDSEAVTGSITFQDGTSCPDTGNDPTPSTTRLPDYH
ncbi:hypothetical protein NX722_07660 [Endozoicomonas gorgoniicola]|uniref:Right-handed parallel beta-helix repeat-containing protein n=1 Tax=Endozoicomonas gorgoniicola TaxID=1234144 RepID=A0ABT3MU66_9GAMM|nr:hypothetical protein [Endozoicomonas gorgoniicola]MCW7552524.1 hypothetical protein [Endozoicomonas gorgoniicola]